MTGVRLSTKATLNDNIDKIYDYINTDDSHNALKQLKKAKLNVRKYYNTRGMDCKRFTSIFSNIESLLERSFRKQIYKDQLYDKMFLLNQELKVTTLMKDKSGHEITDPVNMLRMIIDDLIDDYSAFNLSGGHDVVEKNIEILEVIRNDLLEIRELESLFRKHSPYLLTEYGNLIQAINACLMVIPQVKSITISSNIAKNFREAFESLFNIASTMFIPVKKKERDEEKRELAEEIKGEVEKEEIREQEEKPSDEIKSDEIKSDEIQIGENMDLAELEKRAREGTLGDGTT